MASSASPAPVGVVEGRLRARTTEGKRSLGELSDKERGLKAASAVLAGELSLARAMDLYMVSGSVLRYYRKKLVSSGMPDKSSALSRAASPTPSCDSTSSTKSKVDAFDDYKQAYMWAGQQVQKLGRREAAARATQMFGVQISASTARRAAQHPGEPPVKPGRDLIIPEEVEHKLESLCLALRELKLPVFRLMVINYVNTLLDGTELKERLAHKEVRKCWYYNLEGDDASSGSDSDDEDL